MPVIAYDRALAQGMTSRNAQECSFWNAHRALHPTSLDTAADVLRYRQQAKELLKLSEQLRDHEDALAAGIAA